MDRQYNGQKNTLEVITDGQTMAKRIQWDQKNTLEVITDGQTIQWPKEYLRGNY